MLADDGPTTDGTGPTTDDTDDRLAPDVATDGGGGWPAYTAAFRRDTETLAAAFTAHAAERDAAADGFRAYAREFAADVARLRARFAAFQNSLVGAGADTRARGTREFEAAAREFWADVARLREAAAAEATARAAFEAEVARTRREFRAYAADFAAVTAGDGVTADGETVREDEQRSDDETVREDEQRSDDETVREDEQRSDDETVREDEQRSDDETVREDEQRSDAADGERPEEVVACRECGEFYQAITAPHLQTHDMTVAEYRETYGENVPLRPDGEP